MDKIQNKLMKSKSSNGTTTVKGRTRKGDKKSRSTAELKSFALKKRRAYVEKKPTTISMTEPTEATPVRLKCVPRPAKKQFLTSILNILSTSTAGTQCAYSSDPNPTRTSYINDKHYENTKDFIIKKKQKCKTRILEDFQNEVDDYSPHKSQQNLNISPSNYTVSSDEDPEAIKWADFLPRLVPKTDSDIEYENIVRSAKRSNPTNNENSDNDKTLYNFFVDLLENTFQVYNNTTQYEEKQTTNVNSTEGSLEIDMAVDNQMDTEKTKYKSNTPSNACQKKGFSVNHRNMWSEDISSDANKTKSCQKRKLKSTSFVYTKRSSDLLTRSFVYQKPTTVNKKNVKRNKKQTLLNSLKEQLRIESNRDTEPQNFYQSLKLMAKTKRQEKSIQFDEPLNKKKQAEVIQNILKRHYTPTTTQPNKKYYIPVLNTSNSKHSHQNAAMPNVKNVLPDIVGNYKESKHSLKVYAYDFAKPRDIKPDECSIAVSKVAKNTSSDETLYLSDNSYVFEDKCLKYRY